MVATIFSSRIRIFEKVEEAYERIKGIATSTPVMISPTFDSITEFACFLKCKNFQETGSFKLRGAYNALSLLSPEQKRRGVITHSPGNHAQALALAAKLLGIKPVVIMPENASQVKVDATKNYEAEIVKCGSHPTDREKAVRPLIEKFGHNSPLAYIPS